jgi:hypothetical protein
MALKQDLSAICDGMPVKAASAQKLRRRFAAIRAMETENEANADRLEILMSGNGTPILGFISGDDLIAAAPISRKDFKILKRDFEFTKEVRSGSAMQKHNVIVS